MRVTRRTARSSWARPALVPSGGADGHDAQPARRTRSRGAATLAFSLAQRGPVDVSIYSVDGRLVRTLFHGTKDAGVYSLTWDGRDARGALMLGRSVLRPHDDGHAKFTRTLTRVR